MELRMSYPTLYQLSNISSHSDTVQLPFEDARQPTKIIDPADTTDEPVGTQVKRTLEFYP